MAVEDVASASPVGSPSPSLSNVLSKSQIYSKSPPSGSKELVASKVAISPVLTKPGISIMIEGGELTKIVIEIESDSPRSLVTFSWTS